VICFALSGGGCSARRYFLASQKVTKKDDSAEFLPSFVACATRGADSAGKRLPKEEMYIETTDTSVDDGGNVACAVFSSAGCACLQRKCGVITSLRTTLNFLCKRA